MQCSGGNLPPPSPGEGLAPLDVTETNVQRFYIFEKHIEKATLALPLGELARHSRD